MSQFESFPFLDVSLPRIQIGVNPNTFGSATRISIPLVTEFAGRAFPISIVYSRLGNDDGLRSISSLSFAYWVTKYANYVILARPGFPEQRFDLQAQSSPQCYVNLSTGERIYKTGVSPQDSLTLFSADGLRYQFPFGGGFVERIALPDGMVFRVYFGNSPRGGDLFAIYAGEPTAAQFHGAEFEVDSSDQLLSGCVFRHEGNADVSVAEVSFSETSYWTYSHLTLTRDRHDGSSTATDTFVIESYSGAIASVYVDEVSSVPERANFSQSGGTFTVDRLVRGASQNAILTVTKVNDRLAEVTDENGKSSLYSTGPAASGSPLCFGLDPYGSAFGLQYDQHGCCVQSCGPVGVAASSASFRSVLPDPSFQQGAWGCYASVQTFSGDPTGTGSALLSGAWKSFPSSVGGVYAWANAKVYPLEPFLLCLLAYVDPGASSGPTVICTVTASGVSGSAVVSRSFSPGDLPPGSLRFLAVPLCFEGTHSSLSCVVRSEGPGLYLKQAQLIRGASALRLDPFGGDYPRAQSYGASTTLSHVVSEGRDPEERRVSYVYGGSGGPLTSFLGGTSLPASSVSDLGDGSSRTYAELPYPNWMAEGHNYLPTGEVASTSPSFPPPLRRSSGATFSPSTWLPESRSQEGVPSSVERDNLGRVRVETVGPSGTPLLVRTLTLDGRGRVTYAAVSSSHGQADYGDAGPSYVSDGLYNFSLSYEPQRGNASSIYLNGGEFVTFEPSARFGWPPTKAKLGTNRYTFTRPSPSFWDYCGLVIHDTLAECWQRDVLPDGAVTRWSAGVSEDIAEERSYSPLSGSLSATGTLGYSRLLSHGSSSIRFSWTNQGSVGAAPGGGPSYAGDRKTWSKALADAGWYTSRLYGEGDGFSLVREGATAAGDERIDPSEAPSVGRASGVLVASFTAEPSFSVPADADERAPNVALAFLWGGSQSVPLRLFAAGYERLRVEVDSSGLASLLVGVASYPLQKANEGWNGLVVSVSSGLVLAALNGVTHEISASVSALGALRVTAPYGAGNAATALAVGFGPMSSDECASLSLLSLDLGASPSLGASGALRSYSCSCAAAGRQGQCAGISLAPLEGSVAATDGSMPEECGVFASLGGRPGLDIAPFGLMRARSFCFRPELGRIAWRAYGRPLRYRVGSEYASFQFDFSLGRAPSGPRHVFSAACGSLAFGAYVSSGTLYVVVGGYSSSTGLPVPDGEAHRISVSFGLTEPPSATGSAPYSLKVFLDASCVANTSGTLAADANGTVVSLGGDASFSNPLYGFVSGFAYVPEALYDTTTIAEQGRVLRAEVPSDALGRAASRSVSAAGFLLRTEYGYRADPVDPDHPSLGFETDGRVRAETVSRPGAAPFSRSYSYDSAGRVSSDGGRSVSYDARGFLSSYDGVSFSYDSYGDIFSMAGQGWTRSFDYHQSGAGRGRLASAAQTGGRKREFLYSGDSPLFPTSVKDWQGTTLQSTLSLSYGMSHLRSATKNGSTYGYRYDDMGRLVRRATPQRTHVYCYDGDRLVADSAANDRDLHYLYGPDGLPFALLSRAPWRDCRYAIETDALGRIVALIGVNCSGMAVYSYDAWGVPTLVSDTTAEGIGSVNRLLYKGYLYLDELGAYSLGLRHYDPWCCRFWEPDSFEYLDLTVAGGVNLYVYCYNDPISYADPTGNMPDWAKWLIGGLAFATAVALTYLTGGALAPVFIGMGLSILGSGVLEGAITAANGGDFLDGFVHGAADGAMWGGVLALAGAGLRTIQMFRHGVALGENMSRVRMFANMGGQITYNGMPGFKIVSKLAGARTAQNLALAHNAHFIQRMLRWSVTIVDYGIDVTRVGGRSLFYAMESGLIGGYELIETVFFWGGFR